MFTTRVIQHWGLGETYFDSSHPKRFGHTTNTCFRGWKNPYFLPTTRCWNNHLQVCMMFAVMSDFQPRIFDIVRNFCVKLSLEFSTSNPQMTFRCLCIVSWPPSDKKDQNLSKNEKFCTFEARIFEYDRNFCCGWKLESSIYDPQMSLAFFGS